MQLYFFHSSTCPACKAALPDLVAMQVQRPSVVVLYRSLDNPDVSVSGYDKIEGFRPRMTPAYAITSGGELIVKHEGALKKAQLLKFIDDAQGKAIERTAQFAAGQRLKDVREARKGHRR